MAFEGNRAIVTACLLGGAGSLAISLAFESAIPSAFGAVFFFLSLLLWKYGSILIPFFTSGVRIIEMHDGYEIPPSQDALLRKIQTGYAASIFMGISLNETPSLRTDAQKGMMMELFERAISSLRCTTKISLLLSNLDMSDHIDKLKSRRSMSEERLSQLTRRGERGGESSRLEREIEHHSRLIAKLSGGEKPMQVVAYAQVSAEGATREEALAKARAQGQQVCAVLSSSLGASVSMLSGDEMKKCIEWEKSIPPSSASLADRMF